MRIIRRRLPPWRRIKTPVVDFIVPAIEPPYPSWLTRPAHYSRTDTHWVRSTPMPPGASIALGPFQYAALVRPETHKTVTKTHFVESDKRLPWIVDPAPVPDSSWFVRPILFSKTRTRWIKENPHQIGAPTVGDFQFSSIFKNPVHRTEIKTHFVGLDVKMPWIAEVGAGVPFVAGIRPDTHFTRFESTFIKPVSIPWAQPLPVDSEAFRRKDIYRASFDSERLSPIPIPWAQPDIQSPLSALVRPEVFLSETKTKTITVKPIPWAIPFIEPPYSALYKNPVYQSAFKSRSISAVPLPFLAPATVPPVADIITSLQVYRTETKVKHISSPATPWLAGSWTLFNFPDEGNFNANAILGPNWKVYFLQHGTTVNSPVSANSDGTLLHASPVMLDRFANLPTIYTNDLINYDISVRNEFGVERHLIENF